MARPQKKSIDYFPLDCHMDDNMEFIQAKHGLVGWAIVVKLWSKIYSSEGYFCEWNEKTRYLFARDNQVDIDTLDEVVNTCLDSPILNREMLDKYGVLTSRAIQKRYIKIATEARRKNPEIETRFCLISELTPVNTEFTMVNPEETPKKPQFTQGKSTQSKVKESKVNKSKEEESKIGVDIGENPPQKTDHEFDKKNEKQHPVATPENFVINPRQIPPPPEHVLDYMTEQFALKGDKRNPVTEAEKFSDFYASKGWKVGKAKMMDWKAAVRNWLKNDFNSNNNKNGNNITGINRSGTSHIHIGEQEYGSKL